MAPIILKAFIHTNITERIKPQHPTPGLLRVCNPTNLYCVQRVGHVSRYRLLFEWRFWCLQPWFDTGRKAQQRKKNNKTPSSTKFSQPPLITYGPWTFLLILKTKLITFIFVKTLIHFDSNGLSLIKNTKPNTWSMESLQLNWQELEQSPLSIQGSLHTTVVAILGISGDS